MALREARLTVFKRAGQQFVECKAILLLKTPVNPRATRALFLVAALTVYDMYMCKALDKWIAMRVGDLWGLFFG